MTFQIIFAILLIAIGAFSSGSFSIPMSKTKGWSWEHSWLAYSLFAYVVVPFVLSFIICPGYFSVLASQSPTTLWIIFLLGAIYGVANLFFGLSLKFLGLALGFSISLGLMMVLGTIIPPMIDGRLISMLATDGGVWMIVGLVVAVIGVLISCYAGWLKEKSCGGGENPDYNFRKGILAAIFVGVAGSAQSIGIEQGNDIGAALVGAGAAPLFQIVPVYVVLYAGSFLVTLLWCLGVTIKEGSVKKYLCSGGQFKLTANYLYCALAGFLWFFCYIFYSMGRNQMGQYTFIAWGILMSFTIACATIWGVARGEWRGVESKIKGFMYLGLAVLIVASVIIGASVS